MERILLLHQDNNCSERTKDYLELGGYEILEGSIEGYGSDKLLRIDKMKFTFQMVQMILIEGDEITLYSKVCKKLRGMTNKPIIVLSGNGEEWEKIKIFQSGANDYLVSPYLKTELIVRIKAHIECYRRLTKDSGIIQIRGLMINTFERKVYVNNHLVTLRGKEFDILLFLAQNCNRVVPKEEIYQLIWKNSEYDQPYSNTVAVHIKRIREKIEEDMDNPQYLETVWGVGYRFMGAHTD